MAKFNKGDKVRFTNAGNTAWYGVEGIVEDTGNAYGNNTIRLTVAPTGWASHFRVGDTARISDPFLELVEEKPFTFEDIQKGDTIRRTKKYASGAVEVREGVVKTKGKYYWADEGSNFILAYEASSESGDVTLELLNRPEPEPVKEPWETAKAGDRLTVRNHKGVVRVLTKQEDGQWDCLIIKEDGTVNTGITRADESVKTQLTYDGFSVGTPKFFKA